MLLVFLSLLLTFRLYKISFLKNLNQENIRYGASFYP